MINLQKNNLEKLSRVKRGANRHLHHLNKFDLSKGVDYLNYLGFCYIYNKYWNEYGGSVDPDLVSFNAGGDNTSILTNKLKTLSTNVDFREINSEVINSTKINNIFGGTAYLENNTNLEQDKVSTTVGYSSSYSVKRGIKFSAGFKSGIKMSAGVLLAKAETSF